jgi:hypothetical protein
MYLGQESRGDAAAVFIFLLYVLQTGLTILFGGLAAIPMMRRPFVRRATSSLAPPSA